jgi:hypothetical protein
MDTVFCDKTLQIHLKMALSSFLVYHIQAFQLQQATPENGV